MSSSNCCFLNCVQISQEAGQVAWYSHLFKNFSQFVVIHRVKGFGTVSKAEIDVFLEPSCFFDDPADVGSFISGSSAFFKTNLDIWNFTVHVLLNPGLENFEHYFASVWDECNCVVVWAFFGIGLLWDWNENWLHYSLFIGLAKKDIWWYQYRNQVDCILCQLKMVKLYSVRKNLEVSVAEIINFLLQNPDLNWIK